MAASVAQPTEIVELSTGHYRITATTAVSTVDTQFTDALRSIAAKVEIKGFRRGHVPDNLLLRRFGKEIAGDVGTRLFDETFGAALKEKNLKVLGDPEVDTTTLVAEPGHAFSFTAEFDAVPPFTIADYTNLKLTAAAPVTEAQIDKRLDETRRAYAVPTIIAEPAQTGDIVIFSVEIKLAETGTELFKNDRFAVFIPTPEQLANNEGDRPVVPGLKITAAQITANFLGVQADEQPEFSLPVGADAENAATHGKTATLKAKVLEIRRPVPPTDEQLFARHHVANMEELRRQLTGDLQAAATAITATKNNEEIIAHLVAHTPFTLPELYLTKQAALAAKAETNGAEPSAEVLARAREQAEKTTREGVILGTLAEQEKIDVSENDLQNYIANVSRQYGVAPQAVLRQVRDRATMMQIHRDILRTKTLHLIRDRIQGGN